MKNNKSKKPYSRDIECSSDGLRIWDWYDDEYTFATIRWDSFFDFIQDMMLAVIVDGPGELVDLAFEVYDTIQGQHTIQQEEGP